MIRRPPRSTPLSLHDALPISCSSADTFVPVMELTQCNLNDFQTCARRVDTGTYSSHRGNVRSEEHTSELQSQSNLVCRLLLEKKKITPPFKRLTTIIAHTHSQ